MTTPASDHYEKLLGPIYSWTVGDLEAANERADAELAAIGLPSNAAGVAIDLGAGFGLHSLPLARRGYTVVAIDSCELLLQQLRERTGSLAVRAVLGDLLRFRKELVEPANVILCMGDTLTHLPNLASVDSLFSEVAAALAPAGLFAISFRDFASAPLQGDRRFMLVRGDDQRILTCYLEYAETTVRVHDLLHERVAGNWQLRVSSYPKLRLSPDWVVESLAARGFSVRREAGLGGMVRVVAQR